MGNSLLASPQSPGWQISPVDTDLRDREVHLWCATVDSEVTDSELDLLSHDEHQRASRFHFRRDKNRFIARSCFLRTCLANYLDSDPGGIEFAYEQRGKPRLSGALAEQLYFNLSHSAGLALLAVSRTGAVGVDMEKVLPWNDLEQLVSQCFSPRETIIFQNLPKAEAIQAFFRLWTRKEAWLKATGEGITESLRQVEVSFCTGERPRFLDLKGNPQEAKQWGLYDLSPAPGFAAALAIRSHDVQLQCLRWPTEGL